MVTVESYAEAWKPTDERTVVEWGRENIFMVNSARGQRFDPSATPWLIEPMEFYGDQRVKEQVLILPTGAGKTTFFDVTIPHSIAEAPGNILLSMQTDPDAKEHMEERLMPILRACPAVAEFLAAAGRHCLRKDAIVLPHMAVHCGGANTSNFQRKSVRSVFLDEAWQIKHGLIEEARARLHDRWNGRVVIVSQGGNEHFILNTEKRDTELHAAFNRTDRRVWSMVCPHCGEVSPWRMSGIKYADSQDDREVMESAKYVCPGRCGTPFDDKREVRRALSTASKYVVTNPAYLPFHHGWTAAAQGLFHEEWGKLALGWKKANEAKALGDVKPLEIFVTKRLAQFWKEEENNPDVVLSASGYIIADYEDGSLIDDEKSRFAEIDRQRDHFWMSVRAWRGNGSSRLLFFARLETVEKCREVQLKYKVRDKFTCEDARHRPTEVYDDCAKFGWVAFIGDGHPVDGYEHLRKWKKPVRKYFSPMRQALAPCGKLVNYIRWSNEKVKDILFRLTAGKGVLFEVPDDVDSQSLPANQRYSSQITAEVKRDTVVKGSKAIVAKYVKTRMHNHAVDLEAMGLVFALIFDLLGVSRDDEEAIPAEESSPVSTE